MTPDKTAIRQLMALRAQLSASINQVDATLAVLGMPERPSEAAETKDDLAVFGGKRLQSPGGETNG